MARRTILAVLALMSCAVLAQSPFEAEIRPPPPYEQAARAERAGDARAAVRLYTEAARKGDGKAAYRLGEIYEKGLGVVRADQAESVKWYNAARILGYPPLDR